MEKQNGKSREKRRTIRTAGTRCREISRIKTLPPIVQPKQWKYILLPQNIYKEMEGQGLRAIMDRCENNLALLKMKQE